MVDKELILIRNVFFVGLLCLLSQSLAAQNPARSNPDNQWEYAQFISKPDLFQWVEQDLLVTAESQQTLLRRMGQPPATSGQYINDLIVLNHVGTMGWELISVVNTGPDTLIYTFKRDAEKRD